MDSNKKIFTIWIGPLDKERQQCVKRMLHVFKDYHKVWFGDKPQSGFHFIDYKNPWNEFREKYGVTCEPSMVNVVTDWLRMYILSLNSNTLYTDTDVFWYRAPKLSDASRAGWRGNWNCVLYCGKNGRYNYELAITDNLKKSCGKKMHRRLLFRYRGISKVFNEFKSSDLCHGAEAYRAARKFLCVKESELKNGKGK